MKKGDGISLNPAGLIIKEFGCAICSWKNTPICPHGLRLSELHSNRICSQRAMFIKGLYQACGNKVKVMQQDHLFKLQILTDKMMSEWLKADGLRINDKFSQISRNFINLTDKMRRQDEGIKVNAEIDMTVEDFRKVVESQAKDIKEEKIQDGNFTDIGSSEDTDTEKV
jgi:hypothetical protein